MKTKYSILEIEITDSENVVTTSPEVETEKIPFFGGAEGSIYNID